MPATDLPCMGSFLCARWSESDKCNMSALSLQQLRLISPLLVRRLIFNQLMLLYIVPVSSYRVTSYLHSSVFFPTVHIISSKQIPNTSGGWSWCLSPQTVPGVFDRPRKLLLRNCKLKLSDLRNCVLERLFKEK